MTDRINFPCSFKHPSAASDAFGEKPFRDMMIVTFRKSCRITTREYLTTKLKDDLTIPFRRPCTLRLRCEETEATQLHDFFMLQRGLGMLPQQVKGVGSTLSAHMHHLIQLLRGTKQRVQSVVSHPLWRMRGILSLHAMANRGISRRNGFGLGTAKEDYHGKEIDNFTYDLPFCVQCSSR